MAVISVGASVTAAASLSKGSYNLTHFSFSASDTASEEQPPGGSSGCKSADQELGQRGGPFSSWVCRTKLWHGCQTVYVCMRVLGGAGAWLANGLALGWGGAIRPESS